MVVYTVERCYDYEGCTLDAVFSTREIADNYVALMSNDLHCQFAIEEMVVDNPRVLEMMITGSPQDHIL